VRSFSTRLTAALLQFNFNSDSDSVGRRSAELSAMGAVGRRFADSLQLAEFAGIVQESALSFPT